MRSRWMVAVLLLTAFPALMSEASSSRRAVEEEQARLDANCEAAREEILSVERAALVAECVERGWPRRDQDGCERFYADHGNATAGGRAPLHLDLPECVEAHEFRQNRSR